MLLLSGSERIDRLSLSEVVLTLDLLGLLTGEMPSLFQTLFPRGVLYVDIGRHFLSEIMFFYSCVINKLNLNK